MAVPHYSLKSLFLTSILNWDIASVQLRPEQDQISCRLVHRFRGSNVVLNDFTAK